MFPGQQGQGDKPPTFVPGSRQAAPPPPVYGQQQQPHQPFVPGAMVPPMMPGAPPPVPPPQPLAPGYGGMNGGGVGAAVPPPPLAYGGGTIPPPPPPSSSAGGMPPPPPPMNTGMAPPPPPPPQLSTGMPPPPMNTGMARPPPPYPPVAGGAGMSMPHQPPPPMGAMSAATRPSQPPLHHPTGGYGAVAPASHPPPAPGGYDAVKQLPEDFQSLAVGGGGGGAHAGPGGAPMGHSMMGGQGPAGNANEIDAATLPRPLDRWFERYGQPSVGALPGSCSPHYMRLTTNAIPNSSSLKSRWHLPLGAIVSPLSAEGPEVPVVNFGNAGIIRCRRCRTYINPYVNFSDGGRRWRCNVCGNLNEVPVDYFCTLEADGRRRDHDERPELSSGSVEYIAPAEYMVRPPMPPVYFFLIDVSYNAVSSGVVAQAVQAIKSTIDSISGDGRTQVGFLTYDTSLHFYSMKASLSAPQMIVVTDLEDAFLPQPDDLLVNLAESRAVVDCMLDMLPTTTANAVTPESALIPAVQAAQLVMGHIGGKVLLFQSALPSLGQGKLSALRDDARAYGTDKEPSLRMPENQIYKKLAAEASRMQICMDVFLFAVGGTYLDVASIGTLAKYSGGQVYYYPNYDSARDGKKVASDIAHNLSRVTGWESVMRVRCGKGLRIGSFHGHFFIRSSDLLAIPAVDTDKSYAVQIVHEESMITTSVTYFQCALLYTSCEGERRIRVHTMAVPVVSDLGELYAKADVMGCVGLTSLLAWDKCLNAKLSDGRATAESRCVAALREYRALYAVQIRTFNRLAFPEPLKYLMPLTLGLLKSELLRGGPSDVTTDGRSAAAFDVQSLSLSRMMRLLYPRLMALSEMTPECGSGSGGVGNSSSSSADGKYMVLPPTRPLTFTSLRTDQLFLFDNGRMLLLWVGRDVPADVMASLFGPEGVAVRSNLTLLSPPQSRMGEQIFNVVAGLRVESRSEIPLSVVAQGEATEAQILPFLIEDRSGGMHSYTEFIGHLHRMISMHRGL